MLIFISASVWGMFWFPLREIEAIGIASPWAVALTNACPLIVLTPLILFNWAKLKINFGPTCVFRTPMIRIHEKVGRMKFF